LFGAQSYVASAGLGTTSDSALTGLTSNAGQLQLQNGASLTTTVGLNNSGGLYVNNAGTGGGSLTVGGALENSNYGHIGNVSLTTTVTAAGLANIGRISIQGGSSTQATLDITGAGAPATWTGTVDIGGEGLLEFAGAAGIAAIASGAQINLFGAQSYVASAGLGTTSDSALTGLTSNAGQLQLQNGASLTTTVGLNNSGGLYVNNAGTGGGSLTVGGTLSNTNYVQIGNGSLTTTVTAAGLANIGRISIQGGSSTQATLDITGAAAPVTWTGTVDIGGEGLLEFAGAAGIAAIASGAQINLFGA